MRHVVLAAFVGGLSASTLPFLPLALAAQPGPVFSFPSSGAAYPYTGSYLFQVQPVAGAKGYLWSFIQDGVIRYQNLSDGGSLSGPSYTIKPGSTAQRRLHPGRLTVSVRAALGLTQWTTASSITIQLQGKGGPASSSRSKPKSGPPAPGTVLYQANWSNGHDGWTLPQSWDTTSGELVNDGTGTDVTKHAQPTAIHPSTANYAVQAEIQMVRDPNNPGACTTVNGTLPSFGISVREDSNGFYAAGLSHVTATTWRETIADNRWDNGQGGCDMADNHLAANDASLDTSWHTYRVEVRGNDIKFLLDGSPVVATTDNHHLRSNVAGLWSDGIVLNVRSFKVIAL